MTEEELLSYLKKAFENVVVIGNSPDRQGAHKYGRKMAETVAQIVLTYFEPKKKGA